MLSGAHRIRMWRRLGREGSGGGEDPRNPVWSSARAGTARRPRPDPHHQALPALAGGLPRRHRRHGPRGRTGDRACADVGHRLRARTGGRGRRAPHDRWAPHGADPHPVGRDCRPGAHGFRHHRGGRADHARRGRRRRADRCTADRRTAGRCDPDRHPADGTAGL
ncbi:hypothetical protein ACFFX0_23455 [Citricoccus parietis]|uniref:Uncharacterized protein n=1 Tax=Citricoccus parietis TaxID=592307 RepID=A0ABV5G4Z9_9MICC